MESDGELLLRLRSGDERAFVSLVERYEFVGLYRRWQSEQQ